MNARNSVWESIASTLWVVLCVAALAAGLWAVGAAAVPPAPSVPTDPGEVTREALGGISRTDGWCYDADSTITDAWEQAPARFTDVIKAQVRFVSITNVEQSADPMCWQLGPSTSPSTMTCSRNLSTPGVLYSGQSTTLILARDRTNATPVSLWTKALASVRVCFTVGW